MHSTGSWAESQPLYCTPETDRVTQGSNSVWIAEPGFELIITITLPLCHPRACLRNSSKYCVLLLEYIFIELTFIIHNSQVQFIIFRLKLVWFFW